MADPVAFPGRFHRKMRVRGAQIWAAPEPSDLMAWEVCPYIRRSDPDGEFRCRECPAWENDDGGYGPIKRGCRMNAEEACRAVMAVQAMEADPA